MIKKIDHINIVVTNLEESKKFFTNFFGFEVAQEGILEGEWIDKVVRLSNVKAKFVKLFIPNTQTSLEIIQYYNPEGEKDLKINQANQVGFRHMAFEAKNIEQFYDKLKYAGVEIFSDIQVYNQKKKLFYFAGPDNIILELSEYSE